LNVQSRMGTTSKRCRSEAKRYASELQSRRNVLRLQVSQK
jgi:hypothetical protein